MNSKELKEFFNDLEGADENFMEFLDSVNTSGDVFSQYQTYLKNSANSINLFQRASKAAGTAVKTLGAALGSMAVTFAITAVVEAIRLAWDKINVTVQEVQDKIDSLSDSISTLETAYNNLKEAGSENLTDAEKARLEYLENRITHEKELKELEEARLIRERYGNKVTDYFDKDNENAKYNDFTEKYLSGFHGHDATALYAGIQNNNQRVIDMGSKIDEYYINEYKNIPGIVPDTDTDTYANWFSKLSDEEKELANH